MGLTAGGSFPPHPLPLLTDPLPTSPQFFGSPQRAPSLARFSFACSISAPPEKGKEAAATQAKCKNNCAKVFSFSLQKPMPPYALDICLLLTGYKSDVERFS